MKNVIIIGSGPAGITAGIYLTRSKINNIIISNNKGSLLKADLIENYYGFENPISGTQLLKNGVEQYKNLGGTIVNDEIVSMTYEDKLVLKGVKEKYKADYIIIATGVSRLMPNIKGINENSRISFCAICDAFFYKDKNVVVLGNGDYAISEGNVLKNTCKSVTLLTNGRTMLSNTDLKLKDNKIREIKQLDDKFEIYFENEEKVVTDGIFVAEGIAGAQALAKKIGAKIDKNKIIVNDVKRTNIPGLYAIGDCIGGILQISKAVYDGTVAALDIIKEIKKNNEED